MPKTSLIGLTGRKRSGKDTAANILIRDYGAVRHSFADPLREVCTIIFGVTAEELTAPELKEVFLDRYPYESPREILQKVGTECIRTHYPEAWIEAFRRTTEPVVKKGGLVVCSDLRFMNEALHIRSRGGIIIRIDADKRLGPPEDGHTSETEMLGIEPDLTIPNNDTQEKFEEMCSKIFSVLLQKDHME